MLLAPPAMSTDGVSDYVIYVALTDFRSEVAMSMTAFSSSGANWYLGDEAMHRTLPWKQSVSPGRLDQDVTPCRCIEEGGALCSREAASGSGEAAAPPSFSALSAQLLLHLAKALSCRQRRLLRIMFLSRFKRSSAPAEMALGLRQWDESCHSRAAALGEMPCWCSVDHGEGTC